MFYDANDVDPWERQYIKSDKFEYPLSDDDACERYPRYAWVYDKHTLYARLGYVSIADPFIKPRKNIHGMGVGASRLSGFVAQPNWEGAHRTTDLFVQHGAIRDRFTFCALKDNRGSFTHFESEVRDLRYPIHDLFVNEFLTNYSGYVNIETIDDKIVEVHLRPSMQFYDICGGLISRQVYPELYKTYSVVFRSKRNLTLGICRSFKLPDGVRSIQRCWSPGAPLSVYAQDEFSYRYLVVNGTDLENIYKCAAGVISNTREL